MKKTYYEELNLDKNCSSKEIKEAFINLSKKYHPDVNNTKEAQKKILIINEAYSVLGNSNRRKLYDQTIEHNNHPLVRGRTFRDRPRQSDNIFHDASFYEYNYSRSYNNYTKNMYPTVGVSRTACAVTFCLCLIVIIGSGIMSRLAAKKKYHESRIDAIIYQHSKERAKRLGNDEIIKMYIDGTLKPLSRSEAEKILENEKKEP